jgi:hypothetical protein
VDVNDPDWYVSATGEDKINGNVTGTNRGPVKVSVSRGADTVVLAYAGGNIGNSTGVIDVGGDADNNELNNIRQLGPDAYNSLTVPGTINTIDERFDDTSLPSGQDYCIIQGDIITVEYTDPADASGEQQTVTDSANLT